MAEILNSAATWKKFPSPFGKIRGGSLPNFCQKRLRNFLSFWGNFLGGMNQQEGTPLGGRNQLREPVGTVTKIDGY